MDCFQCLEYSYFNTLHIIGEMLLTVESHQDVHFSEPPGTTWVEQTWVQNLNIRAGWNHVRVNGQLAHLLGSEETESSASSSARLLVTQNFEREVEVPGARPGMQVEVQYIVDRINMATNMTVTEDAWVVSIDTAIELVLRVWESRTQRVAVPGPQRSAGCKIVHKKLRLVEVVAQRQRSVVVAFDPGHISLTPAPDKILATIERLWAGCSNGQVNIEADIRYFIQEHTVNAVLHQGEEKIQLRMRVSRVRTSDLVRVSGKVTATHSNKGNLKIVLFLEVLVIRELETDVITNLPGCRGHVVKELLVGETPLVISSGKRVITHMVHPRGPAALLATKELNCFIPGALTFTKEGKAIINARLLHRFGPVGSSWSANIWRGQFNIVLDVPDLRQPASVLAEARVSRVTWEGLWATVEKRARMIVKWDIVLTRELQELVVSEVVPPLMQTNNGPAS